MEHRSLLLVENDPQVAGSLDLFFLSRGFATEVAATMPEARTKALFADPDAIVIGDAGEIIDADQLSPELHGLLSPHLPPIVVVTPRIRVFHAVTAVLLRPCHPRAILAAIRSAFSRTSK